LKKHYTARLELTMWAAFQGTKRAAYFAFSSKYVAPGARKSRVKKSTHANEMAKIAKTRTIPAIMIAVSVGIFIPPKLSATTMNPGVRGVFDVNQNAEPALELPDRTAVKDER
jgi:hypothetical protein